LDHRGGRYREAPRARAGGRRHAEAPRDGQAGRRHGQAARDGAAGRQIKRLVGLGDDAVKALIGLDAAKLRNVLRLSDDAIKNLVQGLSGAKIDELITRLGNGVVDAIGKDLQGSETLRVINGLGDNVVKGLAPQLKGSGLKRLLDMGMFKFDPALSSALTGGRGAAVRGLGPVADMSVADVQSLLRSRGFLHVATERGMEVWTHADGSIVRLKIGKEASGGRPVPHLVKEILKPGKTDWTKTKDIFAKVGENGDVIPKGTNMAEDQLAQFFRSFVGRDPTPAELDLLMKAWGDAGHIPLVP
jgi:hypothetical protein